MTPSSYKKDIFNSIPTSVPREYLDSYFNSFSNSLPELENLVSSSDEILDVGCGAGFLVNYLSLKGYNIEGFDNYQYNPHTRAINKSINSANKVQNCDIANFQTDKRYDVIFLHNVVEHLDNWKDSLEHLNYILNSGGKIIFLLPNYSFPVECHFMLPIFFNRELTYKLFKKRINTFETKHNRNGLWNSLNFVKPIQIKKFYKLKNYAVTFDKSYFTNFIYRIIDNINPASVHRKNKLHFLLVVFGNFLYKTKLINIYKYLPLGFQPFVKIVVFKP